MGAGDDAGTARGRGGQGDRRGTEEGVGCGEGGEGKGEKRVGRDERDGCEFTVGARGFPDRYVDLCRGEQCVDLD